MPSRLIASAFAVTFILTGAAIAQQPRSGASPVAMPQKTPSAADMKFVQEAAIGGLYEVEIGRIAESNATNAQVKQFGAQMVRDHTDAHTELKAIMTEKGAAMPEELDKLHAQKRDQLMKLKGAQFDRAYMTEMVKDHDAVEKLFVKQVDTGTDADLKEFARTTLPIIQQHSRMARGVFGSFTPAGTSTPAR